MMEKAQRRCTNQIPGSACRGWMSPSAKSMFVVILCYHYMSSGLSEGCHSTCALVDGFQDTNTCPKRSINYSAVGTTQRVCSGAEHGYPIPDDGYAEHTTSLARNGSACTQKYPYCNWSAYVLLLEIPDDTVKLIACALQKEKWTLLY